MPAIFKPTRPHPLPVGAAVVTRNGRPHVRVVIDKKPTWCPVTKDGLNYLKPKPTWYGEYRTADGTVKRVALSPNKDHARLMLAELVRAAHAERAGLVDPTTAHRARPVAELLAEYERHQLDRGHTAKQAGQARARCRMAFDGCGFALLADLDAAAAEGWLASRRRLKKADGGFGPRTSNHYACALKAFGAWLVTARKARDNPFRFLGKVNADVDVRHVRRALDAAEFPAVLASAQGGKRFRKLTGPDRAVLYLVAGVTGLRASELASLSPESFRLDAEVPVVVVEAAYSKHRRRDEVPLHPDLVAALRPWLAARPAGAPAWPGKWALHNAAGDMLKRDLETARAAWLAAAASATDRAEREKSDHLLYRDRSGAVADFHALRHTFITNLVRAGVMPKDAKELARHSTITLTMDRYAHVAAKDTAAALARLTLPALPDSGPTPAPGTAPPDRKAA